MTARPRRVDDAQQTHLVPDSRMRSMAITDTMYWSTAMTQSAASRSRAVASTVMSSTYTVRMVMGLMVHA